MELAHIEGSEKCQPRIHQMPRRQKPPATLHCVPWESLTTHLLLLYCPHLLEHALPSHPAMLTGQALFAPSCQYNVSCRHPRHIHLKHLAHLSLFLLWTLLPNKGQLWLLWSKTLESPITPCLLSSHTFQALLQKISGIQLHYFH